MSCTDLVWKQLHHSECMRVLCIGMPARNDVKEGIEKKEMLFRNFSFSTRLAKERGPRLAKSGLGHGMYIKQ